MELKGGNRFHDSKVRAVVTCASYSKMRCIYAQYQPLETELAKLQSYLDDVCYVCGGDLFGSHEEFKELYLRKGISCETNMELNFYKTENVMGMPVERQTVCASYGSNENGLVPTPDHVACLYTSVLPLCLECFSQGAQFAHGRKRTKAQQLTVRKRNRLGVVSEVDGDSDATISEDSEGEDIRHESNT